MTKLFLMKRKHNLKLFQTFLRYSSVITHERGAHMTFGSILTFILGTSGIIAVMGVITGK